VELGIEGFNLPETSQGFFYTASRFIKDGRSLNDIKKCPFDQQIQMGIDGTEIHVYLVEDPGFACASSLAGIKNICDDLIFASSRIKLSQYQKHVLNFRMMRTQSLHDFGAKQPQSEDDAKQAKAEHRD
jgi:hypothetical protein